VFGQTQNGKAKRDRFDAIRTLPLRRRRSSVTDASNLSKLALFLFRGTGHDDEWGADLTRENAICDLRLPQGPEGRLPKREPSPEGLGYLGRMTSAVGAALYRADAPT
jgi:hypothetical protein